MAIRKTVEDQFVVAGPREDWLCKCEQAIDSAGFTKIEVQAALGQIQANYKKLTVWGSLTLSLLPEGDNTRIIAKATANVDNVFALFSSPGKKILQAFKSSLVD